MLPTVGSLCKVRGERGVSHSPGADSLAGLGNQHRAAKMLVPGGKDCLLSTGTERGTLQEAGERHHAGLFYIHLLPGFPIAQVLQETILYGHMSDGLCRCQCTMRSLQRILPAREYLNDQHVTTVGSITHFPGQTWISYEVHSQGNLNLNDQDSLLGYEKLQIHKTWYFPKVVTRRGKFLLHLGQN